MSALLQQFPWPPLPGSSTAPRWDGKKFLTDGHVRDVLYYEIAESNWSSELTGLHEIESGANHPIDCASRALAMTLDPLSPGYAISAHMVFRTNRMIELFQTPALGYG